MTDRIPDSGSGPGPDPIDARLLALLENRLDDAERLELLDRVADDPELLEALTQASAGLSRLDRLVVSTGDPASGVGQRRVPRWWTVAAAAVAALATFPLARATAPVSPIVTDGGVAGPEAVFAPVRPAETRPSFMIVYEGAWPDRAGLSQDEVARRAEEYWAFAIDLAREGVLVAAGDARFDGGRWVRPEGLVPIPATEVQAPSHFVGMLTLRVDSYDEAADIAMRSPHLRYGARVSVRQVGQGFVTVPGMDDWSGE